VTDLSKSTFCVCDHRGLFIGIALRLAETGARVYYNLPEDRRDALNDAIIGDGLKKQGVICVESLWDVKAKTDTFVFPDIRRLGDQLELLGQDKPVWGSGRGMILEQDRLFFLKQLDELGLDVPPHDVVMGLDNLTIFLKDKEDIWIKVSKWRGTWETFHWRSWNEDSHYMDQWAVKFGGLKNHIQFICFPKIETDLEIGADTYCVDGLWPSLMLHGIERKDAAYLSAVTEREDMPEQLLPIMQQFAPVLKQMGYQNQWSMEVRVTKDENFFIDATCRGGLPSTPTFLAAKNSPEVIYHGARGEFVEIDYGFKFSAECIVEIKGQDGYWDTAELEPDVREAIMLQNYCDIDGQAWFPPDDATSSVSEIGWLFVTGDTPTEVARKMNYMADQLPDGADAKVEALADILREINSEHEQGIQFTTMEMPEPEIVLEESSNPS
jgi:hypothetical protein